MHEFCLVSQHLVLEWVLRVDVDDWVTKCFELLGAGLLRMLL